MTARSKSTIKTFCVRSGIANLEIPEEVAKLLDLYNDPDVAPEQKMIAKAELDKTIREMENRVTTRRTRANGSGPTSV